MLLDEVRGLFEQLYEYCIFHVMPFRTEAWVSKLVSALRGPRRRFIPTGSWPFSSYLHSHMAHYEHWGNDQTGALLEIPSACSPAIVFLCAENVLNSRGQAEIILG